ncbi:MAG: peptidase, partial [Hamadaea sp.]|nr:peptidase [Hamadaea sp.]
MFRGDHPALRRVRGRACALARESGHPRTGSEHLLLALSEGDGPVAAVLAVHGVTTAAVHRAICLAAPAGAGVAADRDILYAIGVDLDRLLDITGTAVVDR